MRKNVTGIIAICLIFFTGICFSTIGLGTKFATVVFEKLEPGGVYNLRELRSLPLTVINNGTEDTEVVVEIEAPNKDELKEGYEPIKDPGYIKIIPNRFKLKTGESFPCDIIINIPNDNTLIGRHFQAKIWAHTYSDDAFGAGVVNRIFFSIGTEGPESVRKAKKKEALINFNFDTDPRTIYVTVPAGKKTDISKEFDKSIKLINKSKDTIVINAESTLNKKFDAIIMPVPPEYEFTDNVNFLTFKPAKVKIKGNNIKDVNMIINIPDDPRYYNKKYMFIVKVFPVKPELPVEFYTKVLVTVEGRK
jgi:hypothetical protein